MVDYHLGKYLKNHAVKQNISTEQLSNKIEKAESAIYADFRKKDLNTKVFIQYCEALEINPTTVFNQFFPISESIDESDSHIKENELKKELDRLYQWLSDREDLIKLYKKENSRLQQELNECLGKLPGKSGKMVG